MSTKFNREAYTKVFNDLDKLRDYCRFEGKVFDEKALYKKDHPTWIAYGKWQNYTAISPSSSSSASMMPVAVRRRLELRTQRL